MLFAYCDASGTPVSVKYNNTLYFYVTNLQGDVLAIMNGSGTIVVEYTYDAWGFIRATSGSMAATLGKANALRYSGYIYDTETSLYYLQSRYYNPGTGRFINADVLVATGQGLLGNNMFAYCLNNPVVLEDPLGNICTTSFYYATLETGPKLWVMYDVPLYDQKKYRLCWAFCQIMLEDYNSGVTSTQEEAEDKAINLAKSVHGEKNMFGKENWDRGAFPTNCYETHYPQTIYDLYVILLAGPAYAYYSTFPGEEDAHMVVIVGVDVSANRVYINNPWGKSGSQTFAEFLYGFYGRGNNQPIMPLSAVYSVS